MLNFCTYFDRHYLPRGLALYESLCRHSPPFCLYVLCMDDVCRSELTSLGLPGVETIRLEELEEGDLELLKAKQTRSLVEYYFTCTPALPLYVFRHYPEVDLLTYVDADFYFFSTPAPVLDEIGSRSIAVVPHGFPPQLGHLERRFGVFNVGWLTFRRDAEALACLERWRAQCLEWCYDRLEDGRFADQMYLDEWPQRYPNLHVIRHPGVNLAPCNMAARRVTYGGRGLEADGQPVVCYHFFGLKEYRSMVYYLSLSQYGACPTRTILERIYEPYLQTLARKKGRTRAGQERSPPLGGMRKPVRTTVQARNSWRHSRIGVYFERWRLALRAIAMRRFVLFVRGRIVLKWIPCGFRRAARNE